MTTPCQRRRTTCAHHRGARVLPHSGSLGRCRGRCYGFGLPAVHSRRRRVGLLESLKLKLPVSATLPLGAPPTGSTTSSAGPSGGSPGAAPRPSDAVDTKLGSELDALGAVLDGIHDDAVAAPLRAAMQKVIDGRATAQSMSEAKRVVALNALLAAVRKQRPGVDAALKHAKAIDSREAARKDIEVTLGQVTALVLGGINDDGLRNVVNTGLTKAQADFA